MADIRVKTPLGAWRDALGDKDGHPFSLTYREQTVPKLHRTVTAVDKLADAVAGTITLANVAGTQGALVANTLHYMTAVPGNSYGPTKPAAIDSQTTTNDAANTHVIACTIGGIPGVEYWDLFLSTDAAPKWVARITEGERAAGGEILTYGGAVTAGASAGVINIGVLGTGIQTSNAILAQNNAYTPAGISFIECLGYEVLVIYIKLVLTDIRSAPSLTILPFIQNPTSPSDWFPVSPAIMSLLGALGQPILGVYYLSVKGAPQVKLLVDTIAGQGASASIWYSLAR